MIGKYSLFSLIVFLILLCIFTATANPFDEYVTDSDQSSLIMLKNAQIDVRKDPVYDDRGTLFEYKTFPGRSEKYWIVKLKEPIGSESRMELEQSCAEIYSYVPNNAFIVKMNDFTRSKVEDLDSVQWMGIYRDEYKICSQLSEGIENIESEEYMVEIRIVLFNSADMEHVLKSVINLDGNILAYTRNSIHAEIEITAIPELASINEVSWIEKFYHFVLFNDDAAAITRINNVWTDYYLNGTGQVIAITDTGLDTGVNDNTIHPDFQDRILKIVDWSDNGASDRISGHGTHVAGSLLGDGTMSNGLYRGMAHESDLFFQAVENSDGTIRGIPSNISELFHESYVHGARVHSNSWGSNEYGKYTQSSYDLDRFVWDNPEMVIVFAAGNSGPDSATIGSPATAKNVIAVGASQSLKMDENSDELASFSSRGPTEDGRIKPDIVAPGKWILSTKSSVASGNLWGDYNNSDYYCYSGGTSMSTPIVAGAATLTRQYYIQNEVLESPGAALIKATLINGAYRLPEYDYYEQGWGRLDLEKSLFPPGLNLEFFDGYSQNVTLETGESWARTYYVNNSSVPLSATLVWIDYPAEPFVSKTLVNDLDLKVICPENEIYFGNDFDLEGTADNTNNVEQVRINSGIKGAYQIIVNGTNVPKGPQSFALVISGVTDRRPVITDAYANPETIEANGSDITQFNVTAMSRLDNSYIESITMDLSSINGNKIQLLENKSGTWQYSTGTTALGSFSLPVNVTDSRGNSNATRSIHLQTIDTTPPTSVSSQNGEFSANTTANFTEWVLFDLHPGYYQVFRNDTDTQTSHIPVTFPAAWQSGINVSVPIDTDAGLGDYNYTIKFNDSSGNQGVTDSVVITIIDTTPPYASNEFPLNNSYVKNSFPTIGIDIIDNASGVDINRTFLKINGDIVDISVDESLNRGYRISSQLPGEFEHGDTVNITVDSCDFWDNCMSYLWNFKLDLVNPEIVILTPSTGTTTKSSSIMVEGSVDGTGSLPVVTLNGIKADTSLQNFSGTFTGNVKLNIGKNIIRAMATDAAGNTNTTTITVERLAHEPSGTGSSGSGGGGGGTSEEFDNIQLMDVSRAFVVRDTDVVFNFIRPGNVISSVGYRALTSAGQIKATIEMLNYRSGLAKNDPEGIVYQYVNIWVGNHGYSSVRNIENAYIEFKVKESWIEDNNIDINSIRLNRYHDEKWGPLPTEIGFRDDMYVHFKSQTPGFSPFAITGSKVEEKHIDVNGKTDMLVQLSPLDEGMLPDGEESKAKSEPGTFRWILMIGVLLIVTMLILYTGYIRKRR